MELFYSRGVKPNHRMPLTSIIIKKNHQIYGYFAHLRLEAVTVSSMSVITRSSPRRQRSSAVRSIFCVLNCKETSWILGSVCAVFKNLFLPSLSRQRWKKLSQRTMHFLSFILWGLQNAFSKLSAWTNFAPSGLHAAHRCYGVHHVHTTSLAPTCRHLTFMFCLETAWCSVLDGADCSDPFLCKAKGCIHKNYCLASTFAKAEWFLFICIDAVPSLQVHFSMHVNVHESMQLDHSRVLLCQAGPIYLNNYRYLLGFTVCVSV